MDTKMDTGKERCHYDDEWAQDGLRCVHETRNMVGASPHTRVTVGVVLAVLLPNRQIKTENIDMTVPFLSNALG